MPLRPRKRIHERAHSSRGYLRPQTRMPFLERPDRWRARPHREDCVASGARGRKSRRVRDAVGNRGLPQSVVVLLSVLAVRRVDEKLHVSVEYEIDSMRPPFMYLENALHRNPSPAKMPGRTLSREQRKAHLMKAAGDRGDAVLVEVVDRQENRTAVGQNIFGRDLRFCEGAAERRGDSHDFTRRAHLGSEYWIELAELGEWEDCFLHRHVTRDDLLGKTEVGESLTKHDARCNRRQRHANGLRHERYGSTRAWIHLQHVNLAVLDRELDVDQPYDPEGFRKRHCMRAHHVEVALSDQIRRQHTCRIAGVDARILDVLHDAADNHALAVGDRIDVRLERILEEAVDKHGSFLRDAHCALEV